MSTNVGPSSDGTNDVSSLFRERRSLGLVEGFHADNKAPATVSALLAVAEASAKTELSAPVEIVEVDEIPASSELDVERRRWQRIDDVVAIVVDLKGSTRLSIKKHDKTIARIFEAATGNAVSIAEQFGPGFIDIQGDGFFALFHGELAYRRALAAAITIKTFGERGLLDALAAHVEPAVLRRTAMLRESADGSLSEVDLPDTGYKVGMASSSLLAKNVGTPDWNEPVWAGKAVSWAAKCAQIADAHELIVTERVYNRFENNDFITHSCGCHGGVAQLWKDAEVEGLKYNPDIKFMKLRSGWCARCGDRFCAALLSGATRREDVALS